MLAELNTIDPQFAAMVEYLLTHDTPWSYIFPTSYLFFSEDPVSKEISVHCDDRLPRKKGRLTSHWHTAENNNEIAKLIGTLEDLIDCGFIKKISENEYDFIPEFYSAAETYLSHRPHLRDVPLSLALDIHPLDGETAEPTQLVYLRLRCHQPDIELKKIAAQALNLPMYPSANGRNPYV
jgi:hypothetical protein